MFHIKENDAYQCAIIKRKIYFCFKVPYLQSLDGKKENKRNIKKYEI